MCTKQLVRLTITPTQNIPAEKFMSKFQIDFVCSKQYSMCCIYISSVVSLLCDDAQT